MAKHACLSRSRRYVVDGALYVIRDTWPLVSQSRFARRLQCQYAVRNPNGSKKWLPCVEGVEFAAIQPLRVRANG